MWLYSKDTSNIFIMHRTLSTMQNLIELNDISLYSKEATNIYNTLHYFNVVYNLDVTLFMLKQIFSVKGSYNISIY